MYYQKEEFTFYKGILSASQKLPLQPPRPLCRVLPLQGEPLQLVLLTLTTGSACMYFGMALIIPDINIKSVQVVIRTPRRFSRRLELYQTHRIPLAIPPTLATLLTAHKTG
jgi:hypothetical protein